MGSRDGGEGPGCQAMIPRVRACDPPGVGDIWRGREEEKKWHFGEGVNSRVSAPPPPGFRSGEV